MFRAIDDLSSLDRPLLVAFDTWQNSTGDTQDWMRQFLAQLGRMQGVVVLIAGHKVPDRESNPSWREFAEHRPLGPIFSVDDWMEYSQRRWPGGGFTREQVEALVRNGEGIPGHISSMLSKVLEPMHAAHAAAVGGDPRR